VTRPGQGRAGGDRRGKGPRLDASVVFMGTPAFAVPSLGALVEAGARVRAVVTMPERGRGRGRHRSPTPVKLAAAESGLEVLEPRDINDPEFTGTIVSLAPEFVVVVAYGKILPAALLEIPEKGCVNLHASLLPVYRGAAPINRAVMNGERETGVTTMLMDRGMDTGPLLLCEKTAIEEGETAWDLSARLSVQGAALLVKTLSLMAEDAIEPRPQDERRASYAPPLKKADGRIDWSRSAQEVCNLVRGVFPWPGAHTTLGNRTVKVLRGMARPRAAEEPAGPEAAVGTIVELSKKAIGVRCGHGLFEITGLQPEGKRPMSAAEFLAGRRLKIGERFV